MYLHDFAEVQDASQVLRRRFWKSPEIPLLATACMYFSNLPEKAGAWAFLKSFQAYLWFDKTHWLHQCQEALDGKKWPHAPTRHINCKIAKQDKYYNHY